MRKLILLLVSSLSLFAQSPYYRLGYGDLLPATDAFGASVGTGAVALEDSIRLTLHNPAALNGLKRVHFGVALGSEFRSTDDIVTNNTRLEQIFFAFPIGQKFGMSLGAHAVSDFESSYESQLADGPFSDETRGGIWDYSVGLGYKYSDDLKLGLKLHSFQGLMRRESKISVESAAELYVVKGNLSGKSIELGVISNISEKVSLGLTANFPYDAPSLSGRDSLAGSESFVDLDESLGAWPTVINLGVVYKHSDVTRFITGIGQEVFPADGFFDARVFKLPEGWKTVPVASVQVAMQRLPRDRTSRSWGKRVGWQTGVSIKNHYLVSEKEKLIYEYSIISGLNLALRNGRSLFDISGEFGSRGGEDSLPEELFARVKFGIQINDTWFRKVKRR